nr:leucyl/phenylalanyl-tRNA--protein transferase [Rubritalea marina]
MSADLSVVRFMLMKGISVEMLLSAYCQGVFPMADQGEILWFEPVMRGVIPLDERFHVPKNLRKLVRQGRYELRVDFDFEGVMRACADRQETWIDECIIDSYSELYAMGLAHSYECWDDDGLQGGLYGVSIGRAFFGESMFSRKVNASKVALVHLVKNLQRQGIELLDTQWMTDHLRQFGGYEVSREEYRDMLENALDDVKP